MTLETDTAGSQLQDGVRRQGARRDRRATCARSRRAWRARRSSWRSSRSTWSRSRPTSPPACCPRPSSGSASSPSSCPRAPSQERLADGDVIGQDRSENAIELQRVIDDTPAAAAGGRAAGPLLHARLGGRGAARARRPAGGEPGGHRASTSARSTRCCRSCRPTSRTSPTSPTPTTARPTTCSPCSTTWPSPTATIVDQEEQLRRTFSVGTSSANELAGLPGDQRAEPDLAGGDLPAGARPVRRVLAGLPLPARGADPVGAADRRDLREPTATRR